MQKDYEKQYHDVETDHWWFKSRRNYLLDLIKNAPKDSKILDIGCSSGVFLKDAEKLGFAINNLYGIDISEQAIKNSKANGIKNSYVMDGQDITLTQKFDIIIASDCLEHLEHDSKALANWKTLLNKGGTMYVFVPAFMSLWSYHDDINMHYRRYTKAELKARFKEQNLKVIKSGYWNFFLFTPVFLFRKVSGKLKKDKSAVSDIAMGKSFVNTAMLNLLLLENKMLRLFSFPFGISTFCIAKKTEE